MLCLGSFAKHNTRIWANAKSKGGKIISEGVFILATILKKSNRITKPKRFNINLSFGVFEDGARLKNTFWDFPTFNFYGSFWCILMMHTCKFVKIIDTGSTIRNWDKVKTWLDQMFWQIYQKLMLSGFLNSGNLFLIHHLKKIWPQVASMASDRKVAKIQHEFSWFCQKKFF